MELIGNTTVIVLTLVFIITLVSIIYLLLDQKKFNIKNVDTDLEKFLNELYNASTKSNDDTHKAVEIFIQELQAYEQQHGKTKEGLNNAISKVVSELEGMKEHIGSIQELSLEKEEKIRRYESGYDHIKIKNFTKGLFRILEDIKEAKQEDTSAALSEIEEDLLILLENNGIEKVEIEIGSKFKTNMKLAKVISTVATENIDKDGKVKEVTKDGYFIAIDENTNKVIIPAEVIVYKLNTGVENV